MTYELAHQLKAAGFPQPEPKRMQTWFFDTGVQSFQYMDFPELAVRKLLAFAPALDDITPILPGGYRLEEYNFKPSCTNMFDEGDPLKIRTFGETFAEAAGRMWLELKKQK